LISPGKNAKDRILSNKFCSTSSLSTCSAILQEMREDTRRTTNVSSDRSQFGVSEEISSSEGERPHYLLLNPTVRVPSRETLNQEHSRPVRATISYDEMWNTLDRAERELHGQQQAAKAKEEAMLATIAALEQQIEGTKVADHMSYAAEASLTQDDHDHMITLVKAQGPKTGMLDQSLDVKKVKIARTIHDTPGTVMDFLLQDADSGAFKRRKIWRDGTSKQIVLWQVSELVRRNNQVLRTNKQPAGSLDCAISLSPLWFRHFGFATLVSPLWFRHFALAALHQGEIGRGAKRRADNASASGENHTRLYALTKRISPVTTTTTLIPHPNPFVIRFAHRRTRSMNTFSKSRLSQNPSSQKSLSSLRSKTKTTTKIFQMTSWTSCSKSSAPVVLFVMLEECW